MISMRRFVKGIRSVRCVHSDQTSPQLPKYRTRADQLNNPYRDQFTYGRKPRTFRERYIESKKNEPKPKITSSHLNLKQSRTRKHSFYKTEQVDRFSELGITEKITQQIAELGVIHPTTVQTDVIPVLLQNENCVFIGPTGAGKTYTFLLPAVQSVLESRARGFVSRSKAPRIIIMTPTKFLASQISVVTEHLTQDLQLRTECLSSLTPSRQKKVVSSSPPVDIIVGTYDNIMSHITSGVVSTADLQHLIIDEVESFLDYRNVDENLPFLREFVDIEEGGTKCQITMCGAILPTEGFSKLRDVIPGLLRYLNPYCHVPMGHVSQSFHFVNNKQKPQHFVNVLRKFIGNHNMKFNRPLIFCNYTNAAFWLHKYLITEGINNIMLGKSDKRGQKDVLMRTELPSTDYPIVAVDAASFGLDFRDVGLVVNYEFPFTYEDYIRRCGRTGRMSSNSNKCEVISYVSHNRDKALFNIVKNSTTSSECKAYSLLSPNKFGWIK